jgi:hypothetical protein
MIIEDDRPKMSLLCHFAFSMFIWLLPDGHCKERLLRDDRSGQGLEPGSEYELDSRY